MKTNKTDTIFLTLQIKANKLRIDEFNKTQQKRKYAIVDTSTSKIYFLKPEKKIYTKLSVYRLRQNLDTNLIIIKTKNYKNILGKKCYQWRLKIPDKNTEITYWVAAEKYFTFNKILRFLDSDIAGKYFVNINDYQDVFPMLIVERSLLREWKSTIKILEIKNTIIKDAVFEIPKDYKLLNK
ncbi:MAG: DUF4412 domain-containing protein [Bacteroidales bacterium]|nr:DUF4412 domain-containing protein [Bacteroidales bacterium]